MARIVCVHGVGKQLLGEQSLLRDWWPALADGLTHADADPVPAVDVAMAFYGDLFRPPGELLAVGDPLYRATDVQPGLEQALLLGWWQEAAAVDDGVAPPDTDTLARVPGSVQAALRQLSRSRFFAGVALRALVFDLKQVSRYLQEPGLRRAARARVTALIGPDTRVVVAHSLESVVAYEALCAAPGHPVRALVTLGSPLGIRNLVFDRLDPAPLGGQGQWPGRRGWCGPTWPTTVMSWHWRRIFGAGSVIRCVMRLCTMVRTPMTPRPISPTGSLVPLSPEA